MFSPLIVVPYKRITKAFLENVVNYVNQVSYHWKARVFFFPTTSLSNDHLIHRTFTVYVLVLEIWLIWLFLENVVNYVNQVSHHLKAHVFVFFPTPHLLPMIWHLIHRTFTAYVLKVVQESATTILALNHFLTISMCHPLCLILMSYWRRDIIQIKTFVCCCLTCSEGYYTALFCGFSQIGAVSVDVP